MLKFLSNFNLFDVFIFRTSTTYYELGVTFERLAFLCEDAKIDQVNIYADDERVVVYAMEVF